MPVRSEEIAKDETVEMHCIAHPNFNLCRRDPHSKELSVNEIHQKSNERILLTLSVWHDALGSRDFVHSPLKVITRKIKCH